VQKPKNEFPVSAYGFAETDLPRTGADSGLPGVAEEAYNYMVDSLSADGLVEDAVNAIQTARKMLGVSKPVSPAEIVDYSFLRDVLQKEK